MIVSRALTLRRQLPLRRFVTQMAGEASHRLLGGNSVRSYAQNGEDLLVCALLAWPTSGFYVDVGCHHPVRLSNTYALYLRGLSGVTIDANAEFAQLFAADRPRDKFVCACVGDQVGVAEFKVFHDRALSSAGGDKIAGISDAQYQVARVDSIPFRRLDAILAEQGAPSRFELLSIDVEGNDFSALRSIDLDVFRPRLIVIELHGIDVGNIGAHDVSLYLDALGYSPAACQKSNVFYLDRSASSAR